MRCRRRNNALLAKDVFLWQMTRLRFRHRNKALLTTNDFLGSSLAFIAVAVGFMIPPVGSGFVETFVCLDSMKWLQKFIESIVPMA